MGKGSQDEMSLQQTTDALMNKGLGTRRYCWARRRLGESGTIATKTKQDIPDLLPYAGVAMPRENSELWPKVKINPEGTL
jgi:hypothetical protein